MRKTNEYKSPLDKAMTLYEQTMNSDYEVVPSDDQYKYIRVPEDSEALMVHHFKMGFEPCPGHPANDGIHVVLRIPKDRYEQLYLKDAAYLQGLLGEQVQNDQNAGMSLSRVESGSPKTLGQLIESLPDTDEE